MSAPAKHENPALRRTVSLFVLIFGSTILGALIAPHLYNGLIHLGRETGWSGLRNIEFQRVFGRAVMVILVLGLYPAIRASGIRTWGDIGLAPAPGWRRRMFRWFGIGALTMGSLFAIGLLTGFYEIDIADRLKKPHKVAEIFIGSFIIGFLEEFLFRGLFFTSFRLRLSFWASASASSMIFALVHFVRPEPLVGVVHAEWDEGFRLLNDAFYFGHELVNYMPLMLTLFVMGLVLCAFTERTKSLAAAIGLHAGWVLAMRFGTNACSVDKAGWLFGQTADITKSWMVLVLAVGFLIFALRMPRAASPEANSESNSESNSGDAA